MQMGPVVSLFLCLPQSDFLCWRRERQTEILWSHSRDNTHKLTFMAWWELCPRFKRSVCVCVCVCGKSAFKWAFSHALTLTGRNRLHKDGVLFFLPQDSGSKHGFPYNLINTEVMSLNSPSITPLPPHSFLTSHQKCFPILWCQCRFNTFRKCWRKGKKKAIFKYAEAKENIWISL